MKNACVTTISLQTNEAVHMNDTCCNMDDKIKRQNLTNKFNCLVTDVIVHMSVT